MKSLFNWDKSNEASAQTPPPTANAAGPDASSVSASQIASAAATAQRLSADAPVRRGRGKKTDTTSAPNSADVSSAVNQEIIRQLDTLHDPKQWEALLCFPADTAAFLTGHKHWDSSQREREVVGATGSALARTLMITNPRALAILMCSAAMLNFYTPRLALELREMRKKKIEEKKEESAKKPEESK